MDFVPGTQDQTNTERDILDGIVAAGREIDRLTAYAEADAARTLVDIDYGQAERAVIASMEFHRSVPQAAMVGHATNDREIAAHQARRVWEYATETNLPEAVEPNYHVHLAAPPSLDVPQTAGPEVPLRTIEFDGVMLVPLRRIHHRMQLVPDGEWHMAAALAILTGFIMGEINADAAQSALNDQVRLMDDERRGIERGDIRPMAPMFLNPAPLEIVSREYLREQMGLPAAVFEEPPSMRPVDLWVSPFKTAKASYKAQTDPNWKYWQLYNRSSYTDVCADLSYSGPSMYDRQKMEDTGKLRPLSFPSHFINLIFIGSKWMTHRPVMDNTEYLGGDLFWVKEDFFKFEYEGQSYLLNRADYEDADVPWESWEKMTAADSSLMLMVTGARKKHLHDLSLDELRGEGFDLPHPLAKATRPLMTKALAAAYAVYWDDIWGGTEYAWDKNPEVWALEFQVVKIGKRRNCNQSRSNHDAFSSCRR